jgi:hypothetical protein
MGKMGFVERWIKLIMNCVKSVHYAVLVNGSIVGHIQSLRGLQQGDSLFSFLYRSSEFTVGPSGAERCYYGSSNLQKRT